MNYKRSIIICVLFVTLVNAQVREQFASCLQTKCNTQLLACQNASASCTSDMKSFAQCQSTATICNNQSVPEEEFSKAITNCISFCETSGQTTQFTAYMTCVKSCSSTKLSVIMVLIFMFFSAILF